MRCGGCVSKVKSTLEEHSSVVNASVNLATETAMIRARLGDSQESAAMEEGRPQSGMLHDLGAHLAEVKSEHRSFVHEGNH